MSHNASDGAATVWAYRMSSLSRVLILLTMAMVSLWPVLADTAFSEQQDKEKPQESPTLRPQQPQVAPDVKPAPPKLSTEPKPQPHVNPPTKTDVQPERDVKEKEAAKEKEPAKEKEAAKEKEGVKEKEPAKEKESVKEKEPAKKPVGSLILTVKLALLGDSRLFRYEIEAEEDQQTITLTGRVSSEEDKAAATDVARAVHGVKTVVNKLEISKELAQALTKKQDEIITHLVKERFGKSATLKAANFEVKSEEGIVSISGTVRFQVIALEAAEAARQVPGVRAVKTEKVRLEGEG